MKVKIVAMATALAACAFLINAQASGYTGKTRAEVYQELIEAKQNGMNFITNTSYPGVSPVYRPLAEQARGISDRGGEMTEKNSGKANPSVDRDQAKCTGPVSFCDVHFGG